jgi:hypothetical protein
MSGRASGSDPGTALALGAFLDGIPEQLVLGTTVAGYAIADAAVAIALSSFS